MDDERRHRHLFEDNPLPMWIIDPEDMRFLDVNQAAIRTYGYSRDEFLSMTTFDLRRAEDIAAYRRYLDGRDASKTTVKRQTRHRRRDGGIIDVEVTAHPLSYGGHLARLVLINDITERVRAERELHESEQRYRDLFDYNPSPMWVYDNDTLAFVAVNEAATRQYGYTREEFSGMTLVDLFPPKDAAPFVEYIRRRDPRKVATGSYRHRRKDGSLLDVEVLSSLLPHPQRVLRIVLATDVTERKRTEEALRESEERFRATFEQAAVGMALRGIDPRNPRWLRVNQKLADILGYTREELLRLTSMDITPPEDRDETISYNERLLRGELTSYSREKRYLRKDGSIIWANISLTAVRGADGRPAYVISVIEDITERKRVEQALRHSEQQYRYLFDANPMPVWVRNVETNGFFAVNDAAVELYGYSREEFSRMTGYDLRSLEDSAAYSEFLRQRDPHENTVRRWRHRKKDGSFIEVEVFSHGFTYEGRPARLALINDVTERVRVEEEVRRLNAELEQRVVERTRQLEAVNRELESFAYSVSHDLRAPLRSIDGFSQALQEDYGGRLDDTGRDYLRRARGAAQRMTELVDDLLALSRVSRVGMRSDRVDLSSLAQEILEEMRQHEPQRKVDVKVEGGLLVRGDPNLLRVAFHNLLDNAWKFTARKSDARIEVGVGKHDGKRAIFVRDNGAGFDMAYAGKLFGAFQRLHGDADFPGTGIGLATVQRIIHRHGGEVWAEAAPDRGATFYLTLGKAPAGAGTEGQ